jgi:IclR family transcriptional regulator, acetate operon repressor
VTATGESANLAPLNGDHVVCTAHVQGLHSMRMFTEIGWRARSHSTAVGKAMLAQPPAEQVVGPSGLPALTPNTIISLAALEAELARIREQGYAIDHEEHEIGVRCVAVALPGRPMSTALSVSGPSPRMTEAAIRQAVPLLSKAAIQLIDDETFLGDQ